MKFNITAQMTILSSLLLVKSSNTVKTEQLKPTKEAISERIEQNISKQNCFNFRNIMHSNFQIEEQKGHIKEFCNDTGMFEVDTTRKPIINITDKTKRKPTKKLTNFLINELAENDQKFKSKLRIAESYLMDFLKLKGDSCEEKQKEIGKLEHGMKRAELEATLSRFPIDSNNLSFALLSSDYYPSGGLKYLYYSILKVFESIGANCDALSVIESQLKAVIVEMADETVECTNQYNLVCLGREELHTFQYINKTGALSIIISYYQAYLYAELDKCSTNKLDDSLMLIYRDLYYRIYTLDVISRLILNIKLPTNYVTYKIKGSSALCMFDRMAYVWKLTPSNIYHSVNDLDTPISVEQLLTKVEEFAKMYSYSIEELGSTTTSHNLESDRSKDICRLSRGLMHITRGIIKQENALESEKDKMDN